MYKINFSRLPIAAGIFTALAVTSSYSDIVFEESFQSGPGQFSSNGRVYTGSYGARIRGGSDGAIQSPSINTAAYGNLSLQVTRALSGLDQGEAGTISVSLNGQAYTTLESTQNGSGRMTFPLGSDIDSVSVRFSLNASSYFETFEVTGFTLSGDPASDNPDDDENPDDNNDNDDDTPVTGATDPGTGPWTVAQDVRAECNMDPALLRAAEREFGNTFVVVRYGKICHEYYADGQDSATSVWSTTKTLGAVTVGAAMYQSRDLVSRGRQTGPLTEFQRVDHWLDNFSYNQDATIAHVLSMEGHNRSLDYGDKSFTYDTVGSTQINTLSDVVNQVVAQEPARLGRNIGEFYNRYVSGKLGFEDSTWGNSNSSKTFAYSWTASARDMARLGLLMLNGGTWNGERLLDTNYVYNMSHAAFEDGSTRYGYLTWLSEDDDCGPAPIHRSYPHGISQAPDCGRSGRGCEQTQDVGVFFAAGLGGQYIIQHRGLDMVIVVKESGSQSSEEVVRVWDAIRPAVVAFDPAYPGDEREFCSAYGDNDYAPDLKLWEGGL